MLENSNIGTQFSKIKSGGLFNKNYRNEFERKNDAV